MFAQGREGPPVGRDLRGRCCHQACDSGRLWVTLTPCHILIGKTALGIRGARAAGAWLVALFLPSAARTWETGDWLGHSSPSSACQGAVLALPRWQGLS